MTWICVAALALGYVVFPLWEAIAGVDLPDPDGSAFTPVLLGILGSGALRAVDKRS